MKIAIDQIRIDEEARIRKEIGNLKTLEDSIAAVGLLNPILIDEQNNLVAGYRRLAACKNLELTEVEVKIVEFKGDELKMLEAEIAENFFRKDFSPEEVLATERRRQEIIEKNRKKGWWERFIMWLKSIFTSQPVPEISPKGRTASREPQSDQTPSPSDAKKTNTSAAVDTAVDTAVDESNHQQGTVVEETSTEAPETAPMNGADEEKGERQAEPGKKDLRQQISDTNREGRSAQDTRTIQWRTS